MIFIKKMKSSKRSPPYMERRYKPLKLVTGYKVSETPVT